jgi:hypothetical protein
MPTVPRRCGEFREVVGLPMRRYRPRSITRSGCFERVWRDTAPPFTVLRPSRFLARIHPAKPAKSGEIRVGRVQNIPPLDREDGQMGIRGEVAGGPKTLELGPKPLKVCIRRLRNMNMRQREPSLKLLHYALDRKRTRHDFAVSRDTHETEHCRPSEPDAFGAREAGVPPQPSPLVKRGISVVRVNEDVYVGQYQGFCPRNPLPLAHPRAARVCRDRYPAGTRRNRKSSSAPDGLGWRRPHPVRRELID